MFYVISLCMYLWAVLADDQSAVSLWDLDQSAVSLCDLDLATGVTLHGDRGHKLLVRHNRLQTLKHDTTKILELKITCFTVFNLSISLMCFFQKSKAVTFEPLIFFLVDIIAYFTAYVSIMEYNLCQSSPTITAKNPTNPFFLSKSFYIRYV